MCAFRGLQCAHGKPLYLMAASLCYEGIVFGQEASPSLQWICTSGRTKSQGTSPRLIKSFVWRYRQKSQPIIIPDGLRRTGLGILDIFKDVYSIEITAPIRPARLTDRGFLQLQSPRRLLLCCLNRLHGQIVVSLRHTCSILHRRGTTEHGCHDENHSARRLVGVL